MPNYLGPKSWGWTLLLAHPVPDGGTCTLSTPDYHGELTDPDSAELAVGNQVIDLPEKATVVFAADLECTVTNLTGYEWPAAETVYVYARAKESLELTPDILTFFNLDNPPFYFTKPNKMTVPLSFNKGTRAWGFVQSRVYCRDHDGANVTIPDSSLSWRTTDGAIATSTDEDSPNAVIEFRGLGVATVTCRCDAFESEWGCEFTVVADPPPVDVEGPATTAAILIDPSVPMHTLIGDGLNVAVSYGDGAGNMVPPTEPPVWVSSDSAIATVTPTANPAAANIATLALGEAIITVTSGAITDTIEVHVVDEADIPGAPTRADMVSTIPEAPEEVIIGLDDDIGVTMLTYDAAGLGIPDSPYTFVSDDPAILTIAPSGPNDAFITGVAAGTATVTATLDSDPTILDSITIQVVDLSQMGPPVDTTSATSVVLIPPKVPKLVLGETLIVPVEYRRGPNVAPPPYGAGYGNKLVSMSESLVITIGVNSNQNQVELVSPGNLTGWAVYRYSHPSEFTVTDGTNLVAELRVEVVASAEEL